MTLDTAHSVEEVLAHGWLARIADDARQIMAAVASDAEEVLADATSEMVKAALPNDLTTLYRRGASGETRTPTSLRTPGPKPRGGVSTHTQSTRKSRSRAGVRGVDLTESPPVRADLHPFLR
jgi:hypothetical protein